MNAPTPLRLATEPPPERVELEIDTDDLDFLFEQFGSGDEPPPAREQPPSVPRHPLLNPDFWLFFGANMLLLLCFTSFVPGNNLEVLMFASLILSTLGLVANLTRDRQGMFIHVRHFHVRLWPMHFGWQPPAAPLSERKGFERF